MRICHLLIATLLWVTSLKETHSNPLNITNIRLQPHETLNTTVSWKTTTVVVFLNSTLYTVPNEIFTAMPKLKTLSAVGCQIQGIYAGKEPQAKRLRKLDLSLNQIAQLYGVQFEWATNLNNMNLSHNVISEMSQATFAGLISLIELDLSWNQLKILRPGTFRELKSLKRLKLGGNQLQKIDHSTFIGLETLKTIALDFNRISEIDDFTFKEATALNKVILSNNQISRIEPKAFYGLSMINNLMLSGNKLNTINDVLLPMSLERLYLNNNDLLSFIFGAANLKSLDLSNNANMKWQTNALALLKNVQYVNLSDTNLSPLTLEEGLLKNSKKIIGLDLSENNLKTIRFENFSELKNLKYLNLNKAHLTEINGYEEIRKTLPNIQVLAIAGNEWNCQYSEKMSALMKASAIKVSAIKCLKPISTALTSTENISLPTISPHALIDFTTTANFEITEDNNIASSTNNFYFLDDFSPTTIKIVDNLSFTEDGSVSTTDVDTTTDKSSILTSDQEYFQTTIIESEKNKPTTPFIENSQTHVNLAAKMNTIFEFTENSNIQPTVTYFLDDPTFIDDKTTMQYDGTTDSFLIVDSFKTFAFTSSTNQEFAIDSSVETLETTTSFKTVIVDQVKDFVSFFGTTYAHTFSTFTFFEDELLENSIKKFSRRSSEPESSTRQFEKPTTKLQAFKIDYMIPKANGEFTDDFYGDKSIVDYGKEDSVDFTSQASSSDVPILETKITVEPSQNSTTKKPKLKTTKVGADNFISSSNVSQTVNADKTVQGSLYSKFVQLLLITGLVIVSLIVSILFCGCYIFARKKRRKLASRDIQLVRIS